jgi:homoserine dehydrogenase
VRQALTVGKSAVLANKAPLVVAYDELTALASGGASGCDPDERLRFSATVCGGLPVVNIGRRDMRCTGCVFSRVEGVFNSTSNYILAEMYAGGEYATALARAQELGIAEADPTLDVDGFDTANKLVIIANSVLGYSCGLADVDLDGVRGVTPAMIAEAKAGGKVYKLVATATAVENNKPWKPVSYSLSVKPVAIPDNSFLGQVNRWEMGVVFTSDNFEVMSLKIDEPSVIPTSCAVLRDIISVAPHCPAT